MVQACKKLATKDSIRILKLHDWFVSGIYRNIKTGAQISYPFHLWHTIETAEDFKSTLNFLNFIFSEGGRIDRERGILVTIADDATIERVMEAFDVNKVFISHLCHVFQNCIFRRDRRDAFGCKTVINHSKAFLNGHTFPWSEKSIENTDSKAEILCIWHNIFKIESDPYLCHTASCVVARSVHGGVKNSDASRYIAYEPVLRRCPWTGLEPTLSCKDSNYL